MQHVIVEIKARCIHPERIREILRQAGARFAGTDHQVDTYFRVSEGRLKLREGNIENALIFYQRPDQHGPKQSDVTMCPLTLPSAELKAVLTAALGVRAVVDKTREIYFVGNIKFHIDVVQGLGSFMEIEAIGTAEHHHELRRQCEDYIRRLGIGDDDLLTCSYSDMLG